jgi:hypothetical protein
VTGSEQSRPAGALSDCINPSVAQARAHLLLWAGLIVEADAVSEDPAWRLLRAYLLAAALIGDDLSAVGRWVTNPTDPEPVSILRRYPDQAPAGWLDDVLEVRTLPVSALGGVLSALSGALLSAVLLLPGQDEPTC